ncbi:hypothetical protein Aasi_0305 [Candidatus Amoebophilus asiaticus 5a2]|uniref:DUF5683 domain-containing protein n=1 Tax=Amoebophilus asiaticus (strain 5a2) TaxID=452471 RepID=B3ER89_AMOA5|nr:DUF5683 domain-containing protein [Candidatus Amoebophilus asiaticus]ACE05741.1 hypothetical protein Aasi_0305 [Candidatus Amoebophilus asiaticus 5a2]
MFKLRAFLCIALVSISLDNALAFDKPQANASYSYTTYYSQNLSFEPSLLSSYADSMLVKTPLKQTHPLINKNKQKQQLKKVHPRKKLLEDAPIHTQRAWLYSAIIPGLGQVYNKNYWRVPLIYGVFGLLAWGAIYNHLEYTATKRDLLKEYGDELPKSSSLVNFMDGRKRDRTIFILASALWYLINVFDAYVGGTLKTFDVSDDLAVVIQPNEPKDIAQNTGIGLTISLQPKDENSFNWLR